MQSSESSQSEKEHSDYKPSGCKKEMSSKGKKEIMDVKQHFFLCESSQVKKLIKDTNESSSCATSNCNSE